VRNPNFSQITVLPYEYIYFAHPQGFSVFLQASVHSLWTCLPSSYLFHPAFLYPPSLLYRTFTALSFICWTFTALLFITTFTFWTFYYGYIHRPPSWTTTTTMDLNPRHRQPGPSLNAPPLLLDSHCRPLLDPSILYIPSYTIYVTTTLLDPLSPPGPTLSTEPSPPSNLSILYILSPPSRILTAFHPDPHHRLLPPPTSFAAPQTFFSS